jgi:hypothetical protein
VAAAFGTIAKTVQKCNDASRVTFNQVMPDEKKESAVAFLKAGGTYYPSPASLSPA